MMLFHMSALLAEANPERTSQNAPANATRARQAPQDDFMGLANLSEPLG